MIFSMNGFLKDALRGNVPKTLTISPLFDQRMAVGGEVHPNVCTLTFTPDVDQPDLTWVEVITFADKELREEKWKIIHRLRDTAERVLKMKPEMIRRDRDAKMASYMITHRAFAAEEEALLKPNTYGTVDRGE